MSPRPRAGALFLRATPDSGTGDSVQAGGLIGPSAVLMPARDDLGNAQAAMSLFATLLGSRPLQKIV